MAEDTSKEEARPGLGMDPKSQWPKLSEAEAKQSPIERLKPGSDQHAKVLSYLTDRIDMSERKMQTFYARWQVNELKYQAYINLDDFEQILKGLNDEGRPSLAIHITVPYAFATINTIVTYLLHTFAGRKPIFQIGSAKRETSRSAMMMEQVLQYNADRVRLVKLIYQFLMDTQIYGVGIFRTGWKDEKCVRTVWKDEQPQVAGLGLQPQAGGPPPKKVRSREQRLVYSGNTVDTIDPYMFLPDPRVPMQEVNRKGEFVFWKTYVGKHELQKMEAYDEIKYVYAIGEMKNSSTALAEPMTNRGLLSKGDGIPGRNTNQTDKTKNWHESVQGTVMIIPNELGLGSGDPMDDKPQRWIFQVINRTQIVQAELFDNDHDMHPVAVSEPYSMGYGFGHPGMADYLNPMQDLMSWFINSHVENVKAALNNMWLVDPSKVEMQDLKQPGAGKLIRIKKSAYGQDLKSMLTQFPVADVTGRHVADFQMLMSMTDAMSSITDNLRGLQDDGCRKTATEVRTAGEAAASRLAAQTRLVSAQAMTDLSEQMTLNIQQYIDDDFYINIVGKEGLDNSIKISPEMLVGDFHYPVHDGTLPLDKVALLDVWKQIYQGIAQDPTMRPNFDMMNMFRFIAELGGAKNIDSFILETPEPGAPPPPNSVPITNPGQTPGLSGSPPGNRLIGGS